MTLFQSSQTKKEINIFLDLQKLCVTLCLWYFLKYQKKSSARIVSLGMPVGVLT